jgi:hypothetical protein
LSALPAAAQYSEHNLGRWRRENERVAAPLKDLSFKLLARTTMNWVYDLAQMKKINIDPLSEIVHLKLLCERAADALENCGWHAQVCGHPNPIKLDEYFTLKAELRKAAE